MDCLSIILYRNKSARSDVQVSLIESSNLEAFNIVLMEKETSQYFIHSEYELTSLCQEILLLRK